MANRPGRMVTATAMSVALAASSASPSWGAWSHPSISGGAPSGNVNTTTVATSPPVVGTSWVWQNTVKSPNGRYIYYVTDTFTPTITTTTTTVVGAGGRVTTTITKTTVVADVENITTTNAAGVVINRAPPRNLPARTVTSSVTTLGEPPIATTQSPVATQPAIVTSPTEAAPPFVLTAGANVADDLQAASKVAEAAVAGCDVATQKTQTCVADALDAYAEQLETMIPRLPPHLQKVPAIVRQAAKQVRMAKTKAEAVRAVKAAIAQVHKTIALIRADDPDLRGSETREVGLVEQTLGAAEVKLEKATDL